MFSVPETLDSLSSNAHLEKLKSEEQVTDLGTDVEKEMVGNELQSQLPMDYLFCRSTVVGSNWPNCGLTIDFWKVSKSNPNGL